MGLIRKDRVESSITSVPFQNRGSSKIQELFYSEITQNKLSYYSYMFGLVMSSSILVCKVCLGQFLHEEVQYTRIHR